MKRSPLAGHQQPGTSCLTLSRGLDGVDGRRHTHLGGALEQTCVPSACRRVDQQPRPPAKSPAELRAEHTRALHRAHSSHAGCGKPRAGTDSPRLQSTTRAAGDAAMCGTCMHHWSRPHRRREDPGESCTSSWVEWRHRGIAIAACTTGERESLQETWGRPMGSAVRPPVVASSNDPVKGFTTRAPTIDANFLYVATPPTATRR